MSEDIVKQAIFLSKNGKKLEARKLLQQLLKTDKQNIMAWLWYADTWPDDQGKIGALEICSIYHPNDSRIQQALRSLYSRQETHIPQSSPNSTHPEPVSALPHIEATKICPFCAETLKYSATICHYCGHEFDADQIHQAQTPARSNAGNCVNWPVDAGLRPAPTKLHTIRQTTTSTANIRSNSASLSCKHKTQSSSISFSIFRASSLPCCLSDNSIIGFVASASF